MINEGILPLLSIENICLEAIDSVDAVPILKSKEMKNQVLIMTAQQLEKRINIKVNCKILLRRNIDGH